MMRKLPLQSKEKYIRKKCVVPHRCVCLKQTNKHKKTPLEYTLNIKEVNGKQTTKKETSNPKSNLPLISSSSCGPSCPYLSPPPLLFSLAVFVSGLPRGHGIPRMQKEGTAQRTPQKFCRPTGPYQGADQRRGPVSTSHSHPHGSKSGGRVSASPRRLGAELSAATLASRLSLVDAALLPPSSLSWLRLHQSQPTTSPLPSPCLLFSLSNFLLNLL